MNCASELHRSTELMAEVEKYVNAGTNESEGGLVGRVTRRRELRKHLPPSFSSMPEHEMLHATVYAPSPADDTTAAEIDRAEVTLSKEHVLRILSQSMDNAEARQRLRDGLQAMLEIIPVRVEAIIHGAAQRLDQIDASLFVDPACFAGVGADDHLSVVASEKSPRIHTPKPALETDEGLPFEERSAPPCVPPSGIVRSPTAASESVLPTPLVLEPANTEPGCSHKADAVVQLCQHHAAFLKKQQLLITELRAALSAERSHGADAVARVIRVFDPYGALNSSAEQSCDIGRIVEQGVHNMWGEFRSEARRELDTAIQKACQRAIDAHSSEHAALVAASKEAAQNLLLNTEKLHRVAASAAEAASRNLVLDEMVRGLSASLDVALRERSEARSAFDRGIRHRAELELENQRLVEEARELRAEVKLLHAEKFDRDLFRMQCEALLQTKDNEIRRYRAAQLEARQQAMEASLLASSLRQERESVASGMANRQTELLKHFVGLAQGAAGAAKALLDGLTCDNTRCREVTLSASTELAGAVSAALSSLTWNLSDAEAVGMTATIDSMRSIVARAVADRPSLTADPIQPKLDAVTRSLSETLARLKTQESQFDSVISEHIARERSEALRMTHQSAAAFRQLIVTSAKVSDPSSGLRLLEDCAFPPIDPPAHDVGSHPLESAWLQLKSSFYAVKGELLRRCALDVKTPSAEEELQKVVVGPLQTARRLCLDTMRCFSNIVFVRLTRPCEQIDCGASAVRRVRQRSTRRLLSCLFKRAAWFHTYSRRMQSLDAAQSTVSSFVDGRLSAISNGSLVLHTSATADAALDRLLKLKHAVELGIERRRRCAVRQAAELEAVLWSEFLAAKDDVTAALDSEMEHVADLLLSVRAGADGSASLPRYPQGMVCGVQPAPPENEKLAPSLNNKQSAPTSPVRSECFSQEPCADGDQEYGTECTEGFVGDQNKTEHGKSGPMEALQSEVMGSSEAARSEAARSEAARSEAARSEAARRVPELDATHFYAVFQPHLSAPHPEPQANGCSSQQQPAANPSAVRSLGSVAVSLTPSSGSFIGPSPSPCVGTTSAVFSPGRIRPWSGTHSDTIETRAPRHHSALRRGSTLRSVRSSSSSTEATPLTERIKCVGVAI